jgi:hypothetical protein
MTDDTLITALSPVFLIKGGAFVVLLTAVREQKGSVLRYPFLFTGYKKGYTDGIN